MPFVTCRRRDLKNNGVKKERLVLREKKKEKIVASVGERNFRQLRKPLETAFWPVQNRPRKRGLKGVRKRSHCQKRKEEGSKGKHYRDGLGQDAPGPRG